MYNNTKQMKKYLKPYKLMMLGVLISLIITSSCVLLVGESIKLFIDKGVAAQNPSYLDESLFMLIMIVLVLALFTFCRFFLVTYIGEKVVADIRKDIYRQILNLSPSYYDNNKSGEIQSRMIADTTILLTTIGGSLSVAMRNIVIFAGGIVVLLKNSIHLTLLTLVVIPIIIIPVMLMGRKMKEYSKNTQDKIAEISSFAEETISMIKIVQSYVSEDMEMRKFNSRIKAQLKAAMQRIILRGILSATVISLAFAGITVVLWYGGHLVLKQVISAGELTAFVYVAVLCSGAVGALSEVAGELQRAIGATQRVFEFLALKSQVKDKAGAIEIKKPVGEIVIKNLSFMYDKNVSVLKNIDFTINHGSVVAIVGKSGAGKTTIFSLLERFYDPQSGSVLFDGIDIRDLKLKFLRKQLTYVPQEPALFSGTVYENILYGNPKAKEKQVIRAATQAQCMEFISKLPEGIDTYLGSRGQKLSTGQKQRVIIARAMLANPKILLLDEATSSLDSENEKLVTEALNNLMEGRTTIVIAHRLATVKRADKIIVLDGGQIVESGTHRTLLKQEDGVYRKLLEIQNMAAE
jgi:ATP-binding cassette subfamily B protein